MCGVVAGHWGGRRSRSPGRPCAAGRLGHSATGIVYIRAKVAVGVGARLLALVYRLHMPGGRGWADPDVGSPGVGLPHSEGLDRVGFG